MRVSVNRAGRKTLRARRPCTTACVGTRAAGGRGTQRTQRRTSRSVATAGTPPWPAYVRKIRGVVSALIQRMRHDMDDPDHAKRTTSGARELTADEARLVILLWKPRAHATLVTNVDGGLKDVDALGAAIQKAARARAHTHGAAVRAAVRDETRASRLAPAAAPDPNAKSRGGVLPIVAVLGSALMHALVVAKKGVASLLTTRSQDLVPRDVDRLEKTGVQFALKKGRAMRDKEARVLERVRNPALMWRRKPRRGRTMHETCADCAQADVRDVRAQWATEHAHVVRGTRAGLAVHLINPMTGQPRETALEVCAAAAVYR